MLLVLLVGVVGGTGCGHGAGRDTDAPGLGIQRAAGSAGRGDSAVADIRLELLQREHGALRGPDRNPFRFERRASAAPPARPVTRRAGTHRGGAGRSAATAAASTDPTAIHRVPAAEAAGLAALLDLSDGRGNVFNGKEGDVIEGRYRLLRVGIDSADLIYLDGRGRQTIRLSGQ